MPYAQAREMLQDLVGIQVSKATARGATLQTGEAALAVAEAEERLQQEMPQAPAGAGKQAMSADGAFVHLVGGEWVEVKTLLLGEVTRTKRGKSARSSFPPFRGSLVPSALREQRWWKRIGGGWNGWQRSARCKMERSGGLGWSTTTVRMPCASWMRAHAAEYINEIGQAVQQQEADCLPLGWRECCICSSTRDPSGCSPT
jgi:hypothetical protein